MFDPSVPPPQPIINYNIQQQDFSYQAQVQGEDSGLFLFSHF